MPFDLKALERGYGECDVEWKTPSDETVTIVVRYRANINNRALMAISDVVFGRMTLDGTTTFPDIRGIVQHLLDVLLPNDHEYGPGWDLTDGGKPVPVDFDSVVGLPPGLPLAILSTIAGDVANPNRRKPSRRGSSQGANSEPIESQIITGSSATPNGQGSLPGPSPALVTVGSGSAGESGFGV
jgi:hypothetical protein